MEQHNPQDLETSILWARTQEQQAAAPNITAQQQKGRGNNNNLVQAQREDGRQGGEGHQLALHPPCLAASPPQIAYQATSLSSTTHRHPEKPDGAPTVKGIDPYRRRLSNN